jgi:hypothetical protein
MMRKTIPCAALAAIIGIAGPALAQSTSTTAAGQAAARGAAPPATTSAAPPTSTAPTTSAPATTAPPASATAPTGASADAAANAGASASVMSGMSVKDNTGAIIGEVKSVKGGVATISMGSDTFSVDAAKLGVANGVATINSTQADIKKMMPKK